MATDGRPPSHRSRSGRSATFATVIIANVAGDVGALPPALRDNGNQNRTQEPPVRFTLS
jgi:hypothetical protein